MLMPVPVLELIWSLGPRNFGWGLASTVRRLLVLVGLDSVVECSERWRGLEQRGCG